MSPEANAKVIPKMELNLFGISCASDLELLGFKSADFSRFSILHQSSLADDNKAAIKTGDKLFTCLYLCKARFFYKSNEKQ